MDVPKGEWSETHPATDDIQKICDQVKSKVEEKTGRVYNEYKAVFYRALCFIATEMEEYIIKVYVGDDYLHLWVSQTTSCLRMTKLLGVQQNHKWNDLLEPFDHNN